MTNLELRLSNRELVDVYGKELYYEILADIKTGNLDSNFISVENFFNHCVDEVLDVKTRMFTDPKFKDAIIPAMINVFSRVVKNEPEYPNNGIKVILAIDDVNLRSLPYASLSVADFTDFMRINHNIGKELFVNDSDKANISYDIQRNYTSVKCCLFQIETRLKLSQSKNRRYTKTISIIINYDLLRRIYNHGDIDISMLFDVDVSGTIGDLVTDFSTSFGIEVLKLYAPEFMKTCPEVTRKFLDKKMTQSKKDEKVEENEESDTPVIIDVVYSSIKDKYDYSYFTCIMSDGEAKRFHYHMSRDIPVKHVIEGQTWEWLIGFMNGMWREQIGMSNQEIVYSDESQITKVPISKTIKKKKHVFDLIEETLNLYASRIEGRDLDKKFVINLIVPFDDIKETQDLFEMIQYWDSDEISKYGAVSINYIIKGSSIPVSSLIANSIRICIFTDENTDFTIPDSLYDRMEELKDQK